MSEGSVRQWCRMFIEIFKMKDVVVGQPFAVSDDLDENVDQKFVKDGTPQLS
jgi:hypothetical protein